MNKKRYLTKCLAVNEKGQLKTIRNEVYAYTATGAKAILLADGRTNEEIIKQY